MKAIIYLRVSTSNQAIDGVSLEMQESKARAWCELNDYEVKGVFTDAGISGKSTHNRIGLQDALNACENGGALIVYSLSRLARSTKDTIEIADTLQTKGVDLVSLSEKIDTTTAAGKMVFRMLAVLSEFERDQVSERTSAALQHKKANGERTGSIPYGKSLDNDNVHLVENTVETALIKAVKGFKALGLSLRKIAAKLFELGFKNRRGSEFNAQTIKNILLAN